MLSVRVGDDNNDGDGVGDNIKQLNQHNQHFFFFFWRGEKELRGLKWNKITGLRKKYRNL